MIIKNLINLFRNNNDNSKNNNQNLSVEIKIESDFDFDEESYKKSCEYYKNSPNPKFHRTRDEENLKSEFYSKYFDENSKLNILEDKLVDLYEYAVDEKNRDRKILKYNKAIDCYEKLKNFCCSHGDGGKLYFEDAWEHCHNSSDLDFSYGDMIIEYRDNLIKEKEECLPLILKTISENEGILQKNIYALLPGIDKYTIQKLIRELEKDYLIKRVKKSGSYILQINK